MFKKSVYLTCVLSLYFSPAEAMLEKDIEDLNKHTTPLNLKPENSYDDYIDNNRTIEQTKSTGSPYTYSLREDHYAPLSNTQSDRRKKITNKSTCSPKNYILYFNDLNGIPEYNFSVSVWEQERNPKKTIGLWVKFNSDSNDQKTYPKYDVSITFLKTGLKNKGWNVEVEVPYTTQILPSLDSIYTICYPICRFIHVPYKTYIKDHPEAENRKTFSFNYPFKPN